MLKYFIANVIKWKHISNCNWKKLNCSYGLAVNGGQSSFYQKYSWEKCTAKYNITKILGLKILIQHCEINYHNTYWYNNNVKYYHNINFIETQSYQGLLRLWEKNVCECIQYLYIYELLQICKNKDFFLRISVNITW